MMQVLVFPPSESLSKRVSLLSLQRIRSHTVTPIQDLTISSCQKSAGESDITQSIVSIEDIVLTRDCAFVVRHR